MVLARLFAAASFALAALAVPASADTPDGFAAISATLKATLADTGARGDALMIAQKDGVFYTATKGRATLDTPINLSGATDLTQTAILLSLVDNNVLSLDAPMRKYLTETPPERGDLTIRELIIERAHGGSTATEAGRSLGAIAAAAAGQPWGLLFSQMIASPLGMTATQYPKATGVIRTSGRDYAMLLSALAEGGGRGAKDILSPQMTNLLFRSQIIGSASCSRQDETALCTLIEEDAVGLYAWVDRDRGIYGVFTAPGAEVSIAKAGREIRAEAETIYDREHAGAGLTSAIGK